MDDQPTTRLVARDELGGDCGGRNRGRGKSAASTPQLRIDPFTDRQGETGVVLRAKGAASKTQKESLVKSERISGMKAFLSPVLGNGRA